MISVPLLQEEARSQLQQEAEQFQYQPEIKTVGTGDRIVRTAYDALEDLPENCLHLRLAQAFQSSINQTIAQFDRYPFETPLQFNRFVLQRYQPGQLGITPHRDGLGAINLVCVFNIGGEAKFYRCDDRSGTNSIEIDTTPGHVIFMRAPGFSANGDRPFHYVTDIRSTRYSFGLRQRK